MLADQERYKLLFGTADFEFTKKPTTLLRGNLSMADT